MKVQNTVLLARLCTAFLVGKPRFQDSKKLQKKLGFLQTGIWFCKGIVQYVTEASIQNIHPSAGPFTLIILNNILTYTTKYDQKFKNRNTYSRFNSAGKHLIYMFFITSHGVRRITRKQNKKGAGRTCKTPRGEGLVLEYPYLAMPIAMSYTEHIVWVMIFWLFSSTSTIEVYSQIRTNYLL